MLVANHIIGTIVATNDSPSLDKINFVLLKDINKNVEKSQFIIIPRKDNKSLVIGTISNIFRINPYYESLDYAARDNKKLEQPLHAVFPLSEWEQTLVEVRPLGEMDQETGFLRRYRFPVSPGDEVFIAPAELIANVLGCDDRGLDLGYIASNDLQVKVKLSSLLRKHLAILAISGAGKSYAASVLLEELMLRQESQGRICTLVIDPHGEYARVFEGTKFEDNVVIVNGAYLSIGVPSLKTWDFASFIPEMSPVQARALEEILAAIKKDLGDHYGLDEIIQWLDTSEANPRTKEALIGWLYSLKNLRIFGEGTYPKIEDFLHPGKVVIVDLGPVRNLRSRQIFTAYFLKKLYNLRINNKIPPVLFLIEEAHQFCPEKSRSISKTIIETISREGRKFFASLCLVSQRPAHLSTTALSQCNTHLILRIRNPYDLDFIGKSSEGIDKAGLKSLPGLDVGEALLVGEAIRYPIFFKIRQRKAQPKTTERDLEQEALQYERKWKTLQAK